ncbi:MAG: BtpA/SgcQ family protein [Oscillospiraceae bacterium]
MIVTGCSTGTETASSDLEKVKNSISIPVAVGSGVTEKNIAEKMQIADILIIGTTLRRNGSMAGSPLMRRRHALYCARPAGRYKE